MPLDYTVHPRRTSLVIVAVFLLFNLCYHVVYFSNDENRRSVHVPIHASATLARCRALDAKPGPPEDFYARNVSDRFQTGTKPVVIRNATIWTGRVQGLEVLQGDVLFDGGIIKHVGTISEALLGEYDDLVSVDAHGAWVTPGIIDVHSHLGDEPSPALAGAQDGNSLKGLVQPWLRSLDGLNTHDEGYASSVAGGLTTALILPGSANAIGGQAFVIKPRPTVERSPTAMLVEPPFNLNRSHENDGSPPRWRHMKHACGENPSGVYAGTRMDTFWAFRQGYETARQIKQAQDEYCSKAVAGDWASLNDQSFPENLQWEALVDVLRGRVKVQTHCYEAVDLDAFVRLSNEFRFPVAAFHHAHEAYLVPDVLKRAYEHPPAVAMFAAFARYKREAYRHSEFAPRVLADNDIDVVMKSDHSAIVSRYLIHEAAQAHFYGLADNIALASVTTTAAKVLGLDHRIGYLKTGYDADVVIWDSHPLALGATPKQVYIDGIPQLADPFTVEKPAMAQRAPKTPDFDQEAANAVKYEGLPPIAPTRVKTGTIVFANVSSLLLKHPRRELYDAFEARGSSEPGIVVMEVSERHTGIVCAGPGEECAYSLAADNLDVVDLAGGSLQPGLVTAGSYIGLSEIPMERSTGDGPMYNLLAGDPPSIAGGPGYLPKAVDGLMFGTRDALLAYRAGVTIAVSPVYHDGAFARGLSTAFSLGAATKLEMGAVVSDVAALHFAIGHGDVPSVSTEIAALRHVLLHPPQGDGEAWYKKVVDGEIPLIVETHNADIIATLITLKTEVEAKTGHTMKVTILGGAEAHLLADELAGAGIGVVVSPPRPLAYSWDLRRVNPGLPITNQSAIARLIEAGVTVGIGPQGTSGMPGLSAWAVRNLRFDAGWEMLNAPKTISKATAFALVSSNIEKLLGVPLDPYESDLIATSGGDLLSFDGKVVAVISPRRGRVDFFD
ncbi:carbohydrate esterase family 9 protein [Phanerochaete sordida]|uniref:Carbohydrate esterase family 9 protein n=1 Tax=Phanerochaete sordida TaxID=48140 RepID=A0A9P3GIL9_9APHY|nr:carbohydrate esterase family 9 protein [Phanerochaete sordida]